MIDTHRITRFLIITVISVLIIFLVACLESFTSAGTFLQNMQGTISVKLTAAIELIIIIVETITAIILTMKGS